MSSLNDVIPVPPVTDINSKLSPCHQKTMLDIFGQPGRLTRNCSDVTSARLKPHLVTEDVGPFRVTGHRVAVASLREIFAAVRAKEPEAFDAVESDGMLCCRAVGGSTSQFSNHSWGFAIDMQFSELDERGSHTCRRGLVLLYPFFHQARWYWGAGFPTKDPMHFEPCNELVEKWHAEGKLV